MESNNCIHHWLLEEATGPTSLGRCKLCGEEKTFLNSVPEEKRYFDFQHGRQHQIVLSKKELVVS